MHTREGVIVILHPSWRMMYDSMYARPDVCLRGVCIVVRVCVQTYARYKQNTQSQVVWRAELKLKETVEGVMIMTMRHGSGGVPY